MVGGSCVGFGVVALLCSGWTRRDRRIGEGARRASRRRWSCSASRCRSSSCRRCSSGRTCSSSARPRPRRRVAQLTARVIAHQWWWEVRYPGTRAVTANEIHIPIDKRVSIVGTTDDVIHSFWVPELNRKIDLIPGRTSSLLLDAIEARRVPRPVLGVLRRPARPHDRDRGRRRRPRPSAPGSRHGVEPGRRADDRRGSARAAPCSSPSRVRAATRSAARPRTARSARTSHISPAAPTLAAVTIPNTPAYLRGWIADPQRVKPGAEMPSVPLDARQLDELTAYLDHLH